MILDANFELLALLNVPVGLFFSFLFWVLQCYLNSDDHCVNLCVNYCHDSHVLIRNRVGNFLQKGKKLRRRQWECRAEIISLNSNYTHERTNFFGSAG